MTRIASIIFLTAVCLASSITSLAGSGYFGEGNYWECILDDMPGVENDTAAAEILEHCQDQFSFADRIFVKKKEPWFGIKTANECTISYSKNTPSTKGAEAIRAACHKLYPKE